MQNHPLIFKDSVIPWLGKTMKLVDGFFTSAMQEAGFEVSRKQWLILMLLDMSGGQPQGNLAIVTERDKASLKRLIDTLEKKGLVARLPSEEDKRVNKVHLTKMGKETLDKTLPITKNLIDLLQEGTTKSDRDAAIRVMNIIQENIKKSIVAQTTK